MDKTMKLKQNRKVEIRQNRSQFCTDLAMMKNKAAQLGLWKTMHALEDGVKAVGWECAELMSKPDVEFRGIDH